MRRKSKKFLVSKQDWIRKHQTRIREIDFNKALQFISGEEHYLFGKKYRLELLESKREEGVTLTDDIIKLFCSQADNTGHKEELLDKWYRKNLEKNLPALVGKWEDIMGVKVRECRVRKMKTRWGTCNPRAGRIWISLMLAKRRPELVEYIVVHEMTHLIERGHNKRFYSLMDRFLPGWKELRKELK